MQYYQHYNLKNPDDLRSKKESSVGMLAKSLNNFSLKRQQLKSPYGNKGHKRYQSEKGDDMTRKNANKSLYNRDRK